MIDAHIHRVIVVDNDGRLVGIVSMTDILASLMRNRTSVGCMG
jgi:CBS-domain-containing membrane protein